jgi:hypothetical protein
MQALFFCLSEGTWKRHPFWFTMPGIDSPGRAVKHHRFALATVALRASVSTALMAADQPQSDNPLRVLATRLKSKIEDSHTGGRPDSPLLAG